MEEARDIGADWEELLEGSDRRALLSELAQSKGSEALRATAAMLGAGLASLVNLTDPQAVILVGMFSGDPAFIALVQDELGRRLRHLRSETPPILPGVLGDAAPLVGAAVLAFERAGLWARAIGGVSI